MKKAALAFSILCGLCAFALAGPEQFSGKEMKQVAPVPPPCPNWTGFYIGGFGGYKFAATDIDLNLSGDWSRFPTDRDVLESRTRDLDTSGAEVGGLVGYNYQWHNWVFGLEAAGGYLWLDDSDTIRNFSITSNQGRSRNDYVLFSTSL